MGAFDKRHPRQPLKIHAEEYNAFIDAVRPGNRDEGFGGPSPSHAIRPCDTIYVKNNTGATRERFHILGIDTPVFTPTDSLDSFQFDYAMNGVTPDVNYLDKPVILMEGTENAGVAMAAARGVMPVQVDIQNTTHDRAEMIPSDVTKLVSGFHGAFRILWQESGTGTKWCLVEFPCVEQVTRKAKVKTGVTISPGGSGLVVVWKAGATTSAEVTAHLNWMHGGQAISANKEIKIEYFRDERKWVITGADCE